MKIALITDTHVGVRGDSQQFLDYQKKFYDDVFFPELEKHDIGHIIHLGDLVDRRKYINYSTSKRLREDFLNPLGGYYITIIAGNHDTYFKSTNEINALDELLKSYGNITVLTEAHNLKLYPRHDETGLFVPWINNQNIEKTMSVIEESKSQLCFGHFELNGFEMHAGHICESGMQTDFLRKFENVFTGHFHEKSSRNNIKYLGAPYQMTWSDYNRRRGFHIFDLTTRNLTYIINPYKMFHKIYYDDEAHPTLEGLMKEFVAADTNYENTYVKLVVLKKNNPYIFDMFYDEIMKMNPADLKIVESNILMSTETVKEDFQKAEDTLTIMMKKIDGIEDLPCPKTELKKLVTNLYHEAMDMETE
jgi:DNA repair exonuclease SbcCD nuclease subunit